MDSSTKESTFIPHEGITETLEESPLFLCGRGSSAKEKKKSSQQKEEGQKSCYSRKEGKEVGVD